MNETVSVLGVGRWQETRDFGSLCTFRVRIVYMQFKAEMRTVVMEAGCGRDATINLHD